MVIITENDDSAETTWLQKRHAEKNIRDFMPVYEPLDYLMHANEDNTAGNIRGNFKMKEGASPSSSVLDMVHMVYVKMEIGEISPDRIYVIVNIGDKIFILTLRLV